MLIERERREEEKNVRPKMAFNQSQKQSSHHSLARFRSLHGYYSTLLLFLLPILFVNNSYFDDFSIQVQNFFSSYESKAFIETAEGIGFTHQGSLGPAKGEAYRDNDRISVNDPVLADSIWDSGLNKLFSDITIRGKVAVGLNPNIRLYRLVFLLLYLSHPIHYCIVELIYWFQHL